MTRLRVNHPTGAEDYEVESFTIRGNGNLEVTTNTGETLIFAQGADWRLKDV